MFQAEFTHDGDLCTFEVLLRHFRLGDSALRSLAEIVHDIDLKDGKSRGRGARPRSPDRRHGHASRRRRGRLPGPLPRSTRSTSPSGKPVKGFATARLNAAGRATTRSMRRAPERGPASEWARAGVSRAAEP